MAFDTYSGITGFFVLSDDGSLASVASDGSLHADPVLTDALRASAVELLSRYHAEPQRLDLLLGVVIPDNRGNRWQTSTLAFSDAVVQTLYPTSGAQRSARLTDFQQRNRMKSVYQGLELLLEYKMESTPDLPIYCPVLYDRGTYLDDYPAEAHGAGNAHVPVLEILNLVARMSPSVRRSRAVADLRNAIYNGAIRTDLRRPLEFGLMETTVAKDRGNVAAGDAYADAVRPRMERPLQTYERHVSVMSPGALNLPTRGAEGLWKEPEDLIRTAPHPDPDDLRHLYQLRSLDRDQLGVIAERTPIKQARPGERVVQRGTIDNWVFFLLEGELELEAEDGIRERIDAGTEAALRPISYLLPHKYEAVALTPVRYIRINGSLLGQMNKTVRSVSAPSVTNLASDPIFRDNPLFRRLYEDLTNDTLDLPSLPEVAHQIQHAIEHDGSDAEKLAKIVEMDPAITLKLVRAANSPLYRGSKTIETCQGAIVRLGMETTRKLVTSFAVSDLFRTESVELHTRMQGLWQHSTTVAAICFVLGRITPLFDAEHALLAGLLHDIGVAVIVSYAEKIPETAANMAHLEALINEFHARVGAMILRKWGFGEDLVQVALEADDWYRDPGPTPDYCDLVLIAQLHSYVGVRRDPPLPRMDDLPAFNKLALGRLTPNLSLEILHEAKNQIAETQRLLMH